MYHVDMVIHFGLNKNNQKVAEEQQVWRDH